MNCVNDFNKLIEFVNSYKNFEEKLEKCYHISTKVCPYNPNWYMFKYSQFESDFTNGVVRASRGTVLEIVNGKVVRPICLPFYKFNNFGQEGYDEVDWNTAEPQLKCDGNMIKLSKIDGQYYVFTNGSWANQEIEPTGLAGVEPETDHCKTYSDFVWYCINKEDKSWLDNIPNDTTVMFELVGPKTRVIIEYPETKLWFLGARDNKTMKEYNRLEFKETFKLPFEVPPAFDINNIDELMNFLSTWEGDKEGVVVCDANFRRFKIKTDAYKQLKFIKGEGNFSEKAILESILEGTDDDALVAFPVLEPIIKEMKKKVVARFNSKMDMWRNCNAVLTESLEEKPDNEKEVRKDFYFWARDNFSPEDLSIILIKEEEKAKEIILKKTTLENI